MLRTCALLAVLAAGAGCLPDPVAVRAVGEAARCVATICDIYAGYPQ